MGYGRVHNQTGKGMIVRDAIFEDLEQLMPIAHEVHKQSIFADTPMNEAQIQRVFVLSMNFHDGFAKVVEHKGKVVGCMFGVVVDNHFGIRCAQDLFTYSRGGTNTLIKEFKAWAKERGAQFVQISDLSGRDRYHRLIKEMGFMPQGANFIYMEA